MAKKTGAFKSLIRGVSEQVPQDRLEGQNWEQVNMISDPIRGLSRRRGSKFQGKQKILEGAPTIDTLDDLGSFKEYSFYYNGQEYCVIYRTRDWSDNAGNIQSAGVYAYNKDTGEFLEVVSTPACDDILISGLSSAANVGQYVLLASKEYRPSYTEVDKLSETGDKSTVWVRKGEYSRTYTLTINSATDSYTVNYKTTTSYYEGKLDTSDIPVLDENDEVRDDYQKEVNDRVNAYNSEVNQHLAFATRDIQPENIAQKLVEAARDAFGDPGNIYFDRRNTHIICDGATEVLADDGGDGSSMVAASSVVKSLDELTRVHHVGKTIQVQITDADPYYVVAESLIPTETGYREVIWREGPGREYTPNVLFLMGTIRGGKMFIGLAPQNLQELLDAEVNDGTIVPEFLPSSAGDGDSAPLPAIFERPINYLGIFQDRLVMVAGATVFMSRSGDYFNLFRASVLQLEADDPVEIYALGSEDDYIRAGALIDRNFILFGDRQQYYINGREPMTPQNAFIAVLSAHEGATGATPASLGGLLFFSQHRGGRTSLMQMQTGSFSDTLDAFSVSQQLSTYLDGPPLQILTASNPQNVLLRTENNRYGFYIYTFMDAPGQEQRYFDSWSRWQWDTRLGELAALTMHDNSIVAFTLRQTDDGYALVADEFSRESDIDPVPHLDSWQIGDSPRDDIPEDHRGAYWSVLPGSHQRKFYGVELESRDSLLGLSGVEPEDVYTGVPFHSYFEPTSPFRRDQNGVAILDGRMTLSSLLFSVADSGAFTVDMWMNGSSGDLRRILDLTNWRINDSRVVLGAVPTRDGQHRAFIGREIREHRLRVSAKLWLPLTFTTIEWEAQVFSNRGRR